MIKSIYATSFTRTGELNLTNRKPYRTAEQKREAKATAVQGKDGVWRSLAPVTVRK